MVVLVFLFHSSKNVLKAYLDKISSWTGNILKYKSNKKYYYWCRKTKEINNQIKENKGNKRLFIDLLIFSNTIQKKIK